ncbi:hypothetical protein AM380_10350 [Morganella morganii]|uniref:Uncharacterized protein n=1 Tax=Morganella morganii TaxID=582 RepID=A0AAU8ZLV9_MORMO|nr:hypothetical protein AM380_10350 [Morganella morganii]
MLFKIILLFSNLLPPPENGLPGSISNIQGIIIIHRYFILPEGITTAKNGKTGKITVVFQQKRNNNRERIVMKTKQY